MLLVDPRQQPNRLFLRIYGNLRAQEPDLAPEATLEAWIESRFEFPAERERGI